MKLPLFGFVSWFLPQSYLSHPHHVCHFVHPEPVTISPYGHGWRWLPRPGPIPTAAAFNVVGFGSTQQPLFLESERCTPASPRLPEPTLVLPRWTELFVKYIPGWMDADLWHVTLYGVPQNSMGGGRPTIASEYSASKCGAASHISQKTYHICCICHKNIPHGAYRISKNIHMAGYHMSHTTLCGV